MEHLYCVMSALWDRAARGGRTQFFRANARAARLLLEIEDMRASAEEGELVPAEDIAALAAGIVAATDSRWPPTLADGLSTLGPERFDDPATIDALELALVQVRCIAAELPPGADTLFAWDRIAVAVEKGLPPKRATAIAEAGRHCALFCHCALPGLVREHGVDTIAVAAVTLGFYRCVEGEDAPTAEWMNALERTIFDAISTI